MSTTTTTTATTTTVVTVFTTISAPSSLATTTFSTSATTSVLPASTTMFSLNGVIFGGIDRLLLLNASSTISTHSLSAAVSLATTTFSTSTIAPIPTAFESKTMRTSHKDVIIGSIVGIFSIVVCLCTYRFYVYRKRKNSQSFMNIAKNDTEGYPGFPTSVPHPAQSNRVEFHRLPSPEAILRPLRIVHSHNPQSERLSIRRSFDSHSDPFSDSHFASDYAERATSNLDEGDLSPRPSFEWMLPEPNATVPIMDPQMLRHSRASSSSGSSTALPLYESPSLSPMPPSFHTVDPLSRHSNHTMSTLTLGSNCCPD